MESAMTESQWLEREAHYHRLVRDAYNEGFNEGMREHTSHKGGQPWSGSKTQARMNEFASTLSSHQLGTENG
jgi:hypothetical protein